MYDGLWCTMGSCLRGRVFYLWPRSNDQCVPLLCTLVKSDTEGNRLRLISSQWRWRGAFFFGSSGDFFSLGGLGVVDTVVLLGCNIKIGLFYVREALLVVEVPLGSDSVVLLTASDRSTKWQWWCEFGCGEGKVIDGGQALTDEQWWQMSNGGRWVLEQRTNTSIEAEDCLSTVAVIPAPLVNATVDAVDFPAVLFAEELEGRVDRLIERFQDGDFTVAETARDMVRSPKSPNERGGRGWISKRGSKSRHRAKAVCGE
ncbi:hypothetical protein OF83DRAFT_1088873 [Amylostereum chailletii]|nr:hypothetical protein OF83DRAFT_1088873 [Amylostereum chailletii]